MNNNGTPRCEHTLAAPAALQPLAELTASLGNDPLLTQGSTGNTSFKDDGVLWIKATGKWMADAQHENIFAPLDLALVAESLCRGVDPTQGYPNASVETAMHAVLPHPVVLHVHCVNTIAWAVRSDAPAQLQCRLQGLPWHWVPYVASGLPLARAITRALSSRPGAGIFVLGNHGLVIGGNSVAAAAELLLETTRRLSLAPRQAHPADYATLLDIAGDSCWTLPDDDNVHALATDRASQAILARGLLYPCQAIFSESTTTECFRPVPPPAPGETWQHRFPHRSFLILDGCGVLINRSMTAAGLANLSGLTQVVQRLDPSAPLRYLSASELHDIAGPASEHYRELSSRRGGVQSSVGRSM